MRAWNIAPLLFTFGVVGCAPRLPARPISSDDGTTTHSLSFSRGTSAPTFGHQAEPAFTALSASVNFRSDLRPAYRATRSDAPRSREKLVAELRQLESDARNVDPDDPSHAPFFLRIASTYDELRDVAEAEGDTVLATEARTKAHDEKLLVLRRYPGAPYLDRPLLEVADELERSGHRAESFEHYGALTRKFPTSPYAPYAWLAMAEEYFELATRHPEGWALALAAYRKATEQPAPGNHVYGYALYKLAWAQERSGDHAAALASFHAVEGLAAANPGVPDLGPVSDAARADLASMP